MIGAMGEIILLALGSAVFPMLLAGVAVLLSREKPARLLVAFWLGGFTVSVTCGIVIVKSFGEKAASLGSEGHNLAPQYSIAIGMGAIAVALLIGTKRGMGLIDGWRKRRAEHKPHKNKPSRVKPWEDKMLGSGSVGLAVVAGGVLNLPGPFYLLALGNIAVGHYGTVEEIALIILFNLVMLLLVELPMIGFIFDPERTDAWVSEFSKWLNRNGIRIIALLAVLWGVTLMGKGIHDAMDPQAEKHKSAQATASAAAYSAVSRFSSSWDGKNLHTITAPRATATSPAV